MLVSVYLLQRLIPGSKEMFEETVLWEESFGVLINKGIYEIWNLKVQNSCKNSFKLFKNDQGIVLCMNIW